MKKMKVAPLNLCFELTGNLTEVKFRLPIGTEVLSVSKKEENDNIFFSITYMSPSEAFDPPTEHIYEWRYYHFFAVKCNFTEIEIDEHKYIGNIDIDDNTYAVFYKVGKPVI